MCVRLVHFEAFYKTRINFCRDTFWCWSALRTPAFWCCFIVKKKKKYFKVYDNNELDLLLNA